MTGDDDMVNREDMQDGREIDKHSRSSEVSPGTDPESPA